MNTNYLPIRLFSFLLFIFILSACGSDTNSENENTLKGTIVLSSNYSSIPTGTSASVLISAQALDSEGQPLADTALSFQTNSGVLSTTNTVTDINGYATTSLTTSELSNRTITVTATSSDLSSGNISIDLYGSSLAIDGPNQLVSGDTAVLNFTLKDYTNTPVSSEAIRINSLNSISPDNIVITDANGQASVTVTVTQAEIMTASALGIIEPHTFTLPNEVFDITFSPELIISHCEPVSFQWAINGAAQATQTINISVTRGTLYSDSSCATATSTLSTDGSGKAEFYLMSASPGLASLTADASTVGGPSITRDFEYIATIPSMITLQADDTSLEVNESANLTATVRDSNGNLVKNAAVQFTIDTDSTGGQLATLYDVTDSLGRAQSVYNASDTNSTENGIVISASVVNTSIGASINLTVGWKLYFITLAMGNSINSETAASYAYDGTVLVTDQAANPVEGAQLTFSLLPTFYDKGMRIENFDTVWIATSSVSGLPTSVDLSCISEDLATGDPQYDASGTLDPGEDVNGDGLMTPGSIAAIDPSVVTDSNGQATFTLRYPKDYADWTQVRLTANHSGSSTSKSINFVLPALATDVMGQSGIVGVTSPFGTATSCSDPS